MVTVDQEIAVTQEDTMDEYTKINQCIELLKGSNLSTIKKLRVEIQLIQLKRHLLNDDFHVTACGQESVDTVLAEITNICGGRYQGTLTDQIDRLSWTLTAVGSQPAASKPAMSASTFPSYMSAAA